MIWSRAIERIGKIIAHIKALWFFYWPRPAFRIVITSLPALLVLAVYILFFQHPANFPARVLVSVPNGATLTEVTALFRNKQLIVSPFLFKILVLGFDGGSGAKAGDYFFNKPEGVFRVARRVASGDLGLTPERVTVPEGTSVFEIGKILERLLNGFDGAEFTKLAKIKEGYLFPDTYLFTPNIKPIAVVKIMEENFSEKSAALEVQINEFGKPLSEAIIMASLLEEEARQFETRRIISGILWKRLKIGMPLQVDAVFLYINGKNSFQLITEDLQIDSPYNTYKYKGLPPTPITNPGLEAIEAAITPIETKYLYYLSDRQGRMHYAVTHDEHVRNKEIYLR